MKKLDLSGIDGFLRSGIEEICTDRNKLIDKHTIMFPVSVSLEEVSEYVLNDTIWTKRN